MAVEDTATEEETQMPNPTPPRDVDEFVDRHYDDMINKLGDAQAVLGDLAGSLLKQAQDDAEDDGATLDLHSVAEVLANVREVRNELIGRHEWEARMRADFPHIVAMANRDAS